MTNEAALGLRSWLFVPATRPDRITKALNSGADAVIIDLEDAVSPADKSTARANLLATAPPPTRAKRALRINGLDTLIGFADISAILQAKIQFDFVVLPKLEHPRDLVLLDQWLTQSNSNTQLIALIETARGLAAADAIAPSTPRLAALLFGAADMAADLAARPSWEPMLHARARIVAACALGGIPAIDSPFFNIADEPALRDEATRSAALGFHGKAAIHPTQIPTIAAAFTPTEAELAEARRILIENEKGAAALNGQMIDEAIARRARRVLRGAGT